MESDLFASYFGCTGFIPLDLPALQLLANPRIDC
jgi:hypothetical protein